MGFTTAKGYLALLKDYRRLPSCTSFFSVSSQKSYLESDQVQEIRVRVSGPLMQPMEQVFDGFPSTGVLNVPRSKS